MRAWRYIAWTLAAIIGIPLIALLSTTRYHSGSSGYRSIACRPLFAVSWGPSYNFKRKRGVDFDWHGAAFPISRESRLAIDLGTWREMREMRDEFFSKHPGWHWNWRKLSEKPARKIKVTASGREAKATPRPATPPELPVD